VNTKILILLGAVAAIAILFYFGVFDALSLDSLKARKAGFDAQYAASPALFMAGYFLLYVAVTALSVPGAAILTLAGGAVFGLVTGTVLVSFASSIGATLAFLGSRYLFRDWVIGRFGDRLAAFDEGVARDGAFYLFTLRLIPAVPFFAINLLMGLTRIRTSTYYWVSQIGMLLGTIAYVNAGTQLAQIETLKGIASPSLIASFVALGCLPWAARWIVGRLKRTAA
jgi:uncharacterized membrane protein YdjX (TVP38/TMEM64 family)